MSPWEAADRNWLVRCSSDLATAELTSARTRIAPAITCVDKGWHPRITTSSEAQIIHHTLHHAAGQPLDASETCELQAKGLSRKETRHDDSRRQGAGQGRFIGSWQLMFLRGWR